MNFSDRIVVGKSFLKRCLFEDEEFAKTLSRFIDNSIKARKNISTKENPCKIEVKIFENLILIDDNSGGINDSLSGKDIFTIGNNNNEVSGLGIKKSACILGNKLDIISNKEGCSRKFTIDFNSKGDELYFQEENWKFDIEKCEGTRIIITDLQNKMKEEILNNDITSIIALKFGRIYTKFIQIDNVEITVNDRRVTQQNVNGIKVNSKKIKSCIVNLYKMNEKSSSGMELFINDFMIYDRKEGKKRINWKLLNEHKYRYTDCMVEIFYYGEKSNFIEEEEELYLEVVEFIKENKKYFRSNDITIQFKAPIEDVEKLKEYYGKNTAKAIGTIAFDRLLKEFKNSNKKC